MSGIMHLALQLIGIHSCKGNRNLNHGKSWEWEANLRVEYDRGHLREHFKPLGEVLSGVRNIGITRFMKFSHLVGILYYGIGKMAKKRVFANF